ncbi:MAG: UvrD-helicase domain-containing protein [Syntrophomonadales bacterium]
MGKAMKLTDDAARQQIKVDLDSCLLVEAGAGSGKTASLVSRMLALVREGKCQISTIAAVTFTRKAAAEMKGRLQISLEKALRKEIDSAKKERLAQALKDIDSCCIGTIHAFCGQLLRERPVEAGLDPGFVEMDELEDRLFCRQVWKEYLMDTRVKNPGAIQSLVEIDIDMRDLEPLFVTLCMYPEVEVIRQAVPYPHLGPVKTELDALMKLVAQRWPQSDSPRGPDSLQTILAQVKQRLEFLGTSDDLKFLRVLEIMEKTGNITLNRWDKPDDAKEVKKAYELFQDEYVKPTLRKWREYRHQRLIDFVLPAVTRCQERRIEDARLNYQDLLMLALQMLKNNPEVREYFQSRYTHLLIDEFQDTDPLQAEILFYLTGQDTTEPDWRQLTPRPGSLFVVGDPKQSIYRFRRADIDTYNEAKRLIEKAGSQVLNLTSNFRSVKEIGEWVNQSFANLLPPKSDQYQASFARLDTVRDSGSGDLCGVRKISIPKVDRHKQEVIAALDAQRIARWIRFALDDGITLSRTKEETAAGIDGRARPQDFLILFRYKAHMTVYAQALEEYGIPYKMSGGDGFSTSGELAQLIRLLRALLDPQNPVKLLAVLRGPLFGFSDNQLLRFRRARGQFNYEYPVPETLAPEDAKPFSTAYEMLQRFRVYLDRLPGSVALQRITVEAGILPIAAAGELGKSQAGYLLQAQELLAAAERSGRVSPSQLVEYLEVLCEQGVEEDITVTPEMDDAVRLMNLHKAKGLEAPVVFLAHPGKTVNREPSSHIDRQAGIPVGYYVVEKKGPFNSSQVLGYPLQWEEHLEKEMEYTAAEEIRLLYVAATRARNLLVVSCYEGKPEKSAWVKLEGFCSGLPELEDVKAKKPDTPNRTNLPPDDLQNARKRFFESNTAIIAPSYSITSVKQIVQSSSTRPAAEKTGKGAGWGLVIHRVLAALAAGPVPDLELLVENALAEEERSPEEKDEVLLLLQGITKSSLWQRLSQSSRRFMEIPFSNKVTDDSLGIPGGTIVNGVIDLVFEEAGGWVIADYKTDAITSPEKLQELTVYYAPQVKLYTRFWESLTGEKVKEAGMYFTSVGEWVEV